MKTTLLTPAQISPSLQRRWRQLQSASPMLGSPYFSPEFTCAVGQVRPDVRVAVLEEGGETVGFFPFQRQWGVGRPVGGTLSDHHGVIAAPEARWDWAELLRGCGVGYWQFDHLAAWQRPPSLAVVHCASPGLDLSRGFEAYRLARVSSGARRITELPRKARKLAREVGPLRFEADCKDQKVLQTVVRLKSEQCHRTGALDCFSPSWARELVQRIAATDQPEFGGRLSALFAGDTLVAAHFGMRSRRVWHWWFPVYSHAHSAYSPGSLLLMEVARTAAAQGHVLLDLGKGEEAYKSSFADRSTPVVEGCVGRDSFITTLRSLRKSTGRWLRTSPLAHPVRPILRHLGRLT